MRTLVLFARQPVPGQVKTRLAATWGEKRAAALYECFLRDQFERFTAVGDRRVVAGSPDTAAAQAWFDSAAPGWRIWAQPDGDLGSRMDACFRQWCGRSGDRMILIGTDSPNLPGGSLEQGFELLETHDVVLGPAADGGYWLVGLRGETPQARAILQDIDWSTAGVLGQTVERIRKLEVSYALLPLWFDVDTEAEAAVLRGLLDADPSPHLPRTREFLQASSVSGRR